jgi:hypothetical protein
MVEGASTFGWNGMSKKLEITVENWFLSEGMADFPLALITELLIELFFKSFLGTHYNFIFFR